MTAKLSRKAETWEIYLDGELRKDAQLLSVTQVVGSRRLNQATFEIRSPGSSLPRTMRDTSHVGIVSGSSLFPTRIIDFFKNVYCEVRRKRDGKRVHIGKVSAGGLRFNQNSESITATSRLDAHLIGSALWHKRFQYDLPSFRYNGSFTHEPVVFNPVIDGQTVGNRGDEIRYISRGVHTYSFAHEESDVIPRELWTLPDIVRWMLVELESDTEIVKYPANAVLDLVFAGDKTEIKDFRVPYGTFLYDALDDLLNPHGYLHYVEMAGLFPTLTIYKRGTSVPISIGVVGGRNVSEQTVLDVDLDIDHCDKATNAIILRGDRWIIEGTFELIPAWDYSLDATTVDKLRRDSKDWDDDNAVSRVWRDWILAEDFYHPGSPTGAPNPKVKFKQFEFLKRAATILGVPDTAEPARRLRFGPTITANDDLSPIGVHHGTLIEWYNGKYWENISGGTTEDTVYAGLREASSVRLLKRECGIRFDGLVPPLQLKSMADTTPRTKNDDYSKWPFKIRITASIEFGTRLSAFAGADDSPYSNLTDRKELVMEVDGYQFRFVQDVEPYKSIFARTATDTRDFETTQRNDRTALQNLADELLKKWNHSTLKGSITLQGADWIADPYLGKQLKDLPDRNLNCEMNAIGSVARKYPDIVSVTANFQNQTTTLNIEAFQ